MNLKFSLMHQSTNTFVSRLCSNSARHAEVSLEGFNVNIGSLHNA